MGGMGKFHRRVSICVRRRARQLSGDEHFGREHNKCQDPEAKVVPGLLQEQQRVIMAGREWARWSMTGNRIKEIKGVRDKGGIM